eukprot:863012_1
MSWSVGSMSWGDDNRGSDDYPSHNNESEENAPDRVQMAHNERQEPEKARDRVQMAHYERQERIEEERRLRREANIRKQEEMERARAKRIYEERERARKLQEEQDKIELERERQKCADRRAKIEQILAEERADRKRRDQAKNDLYDDDDDDEELPVEKSYSKPKKRAEDETKDPNDPNP